MCRFKVKNLARGKEYLEFQYILCVGSSKPIWASYHCVAVSIHPMCRFKKLASSSCAALSAVSIHPVRG